MRKRERHGPEGTRLNPRHQFVLRSRGQRRKTNALFRNRTGIIVTVGLTFTGVREPCNPKIDHPKQSRRNQRNPHQLRNRNQNQNRTTGGWRVSRSTNPLDDSITVAAVLNATEGVGGIIHPTDPPKPGTGTATMQPGPGQRTTGTGRGDPSAAGGSSARQQQRQPR